jgi:hypothetical protein
MKNTQSGAETIPAKADRERLMNEFYRGILVKSRQAYAWQPKAVAVRSKTATEEMTWEERQEIRNGRNAIRLARSYNRVVNKRPEDVKDKYMKAFSGNLVSVELECVFHKDYSVPTEKDLGMLTEVVGDGSVRYEDNSGEDGSGAEVKVTMRSENPVRLKGIVDKINAMGGEVNTTCGMHVHLDQRGVSKVTATKRAKRLVKALPALMLLVPQSRLENRFCQKNLPIPKQGTYRFATDRYMMINYLSAYRKHKTIEVRLHGGTLDFWKVLGWIKLCQFIQNSSEIDILAKNNTKSYHAQVSIEKLIRMETLPESIRLYVWRRFRQFHAGFANVLRNKLIQENKIHLTDGMAIS